MSDKNVQRLPAEELFQKELDVLISAETEAVPTGWRMSPRSVLTYITGGVTVKGEIGRSSGRERVLSHV